jgi:hypothetical protein
MASSVEQLKKLVFKLVSDFASETGVEEEYIETEFETAWKKYQSDLSALFKEKKSKSPRKKDPNAPKRPMSAYMLFANANRDKVKNEKPELKFTEIASELGKRWKEVSEKDKKKYTDLAEKEKLRYKTEMESFEPTSDEGVKTKKTKKESKKETKKEAKKESKKESKKEEPKKEVKKKASVPKPKSASPAVKSKTPYQNFCEQMQDAVAAENPELTKKEVKAELSKMWKQLPKNKQAEFKTTEPKATSVPKTKKKILEKKVEEEPESEEEPEEEEPEEEEPENEESEEEEPEEEELDDE